MTKKIGVLHPYRSSKDIIDFIQANLSLNADIVIAGAQDGITDEELRSLGEGVEPCSYAEILEDGSTIYISHEIVAAGMKKQAQKLLDEDCAAVMICCSLPWPELSSMVNVVTPCELIENAAVNIASKGGGIGVLQPLKDGMEDEIQHWLALGKQYSMNVYSVHAAPQVPGEDEVASDSEFAQAAESLVKQGAEVLVMDCMSYTDEHRRLVAGATGKPVIRAMSMTANLINQTYC